MQRTIHLHEEKEGEGKRKTPTPARKKRGGGGKVVAGIIIIAVIIGVGIRMIGGEKPWTSVFLTNEQVYFGKLSQVPFRSTITLKDVYYLQVLQVLQPRQGTNQQPQQQISLVKLGNELHGPENKMVIPKTQILFWEEMKEESQVVQTIQRHKEGLETQ
ncbi:hypothetical protein CL629_00725 [bacterium]|nr:hypothetical protein [bacterium]|tara:strand:- start:5823 stop:6299 length:477 start_codon:yes stop_codon:yes gene_type:complete